MRLAVLIVPAALAVTALALSACVSLQPFATVRARIPNDEWVELGGRQVHVVQSGAGDALVLLHGFGESTYSFRLVAPAMAQRFRVVAIDLSGFGYSERPRDPAAYTLDGQMATVLGVLDRLGIEQARFVAHSYGGGLTLWIAAHHPERVRAMVLADSTLPLYSTKRRSRLAHWRGLNRLFLRSVALRPSFVRRGLASAYFDDALATPEVVQEYVDRLRVAGLDEAYFGLTATNGAPPAIVDLAAIRIPALLLWGEEDTLIPIAEGRASAARLGNAEFLALARCGHVPMEERPQEFLRAALDFLERH